MLESPRINIKINYNFPMCVLFLMRILILKLSIRLIINQFNKNLKNLLIFIEEFVLKQRRIEN